MMTLDNYYPAELRKSQAMINFIQWMEEKHSKTEAEVFYLEDHQFDAYWFELYPFPIQS